MKRITTILTFLMLMCMGAGATDVTVGPSYGTYYNSQWQALGTGDWGQYWKSTATASDGTTPLLTLSAGSGMYTTNGNIYANSSGITYTLTAADGYYISSYSINGTANNQAITITPAGQSGTTVAVDNALATALSVSKDVKSTSFVLTSSAEAFLSDLALTIVVEKGDVITIVDGGNTNAPFDTYGTRFTNPNYFFRSNSTSGKAGVEISAPIIDRGTYWSTKCLTLKPSTTQTNEAVTLTAPTGYMISKLTMKVQAMADARRFTVVVGDDSQSDIRGASPYTFSQGNINSQSFSFTIKQNSTTNDWLAIREMSIVLVENTSLPIDALSDLDDSKCYTIQNARGWWAVGSGASVINSTAENSYALKLGHNTFDTKQQFAFIPYDEKYYLYSVSEGKFAYTTGGTSTGEKLYLSDAFTDEVAASPVTFVASTNGSAATYPVVIAINGHHFGISTGFNPNVILYDDAADEGNASAIMEAGAFDNTDALAQISNTVTVTYKVMVDGTEKTSTSLKKLEGDDLELPSSLQRPYCTYKFYSDNACTSEITTVPESGGNVYVAIDEWSGPEYTADATAPVYTNLSIRSKYLVYKSDATGEVSLREVSEPYSDDASWAFIGNPYDGFNIINKYKGTGNYLTYTTIVTGGNSGNNNIQFVAKATAEAANEGRGSSWLIDSNNNGFVLRMKENNNIYFHHDNSNNFLRTCSKAEWSAVHSDAGSTLVTISDDEALYSLYDLLKDVPYGTGVGQYHSTDEENMPTNSIGTNLDGVKLVIDNNMMAAYPDAYNALKGIRDGIALSSPSAGYYRLKGLTSGKYLAAGLASNNKFAMTDATDATTIFYLSDSKLRNVSSGKYNATTSSAWAWADEVGSAATVEFVDGLTGLDGFLGTYGIKTGTVYFYDNGDNSSSADRGGVTISASENARYRKWQLESVSSYNLTLNGPIDSEYYATLCLPFDVTISGADAYTLDQSGKWLVPAQLDGNEVPAGTPVLLKGTEETANVAINTGDAFSSTSNVNDLHGVYVPTDFALDEMATGEESSDVACTSEYFLGVFNNEVGFYHSGVTSKTENDIKYYTLGANKAYLPVGGESRGFAIKWSDDDVTGIRAINNGKQAQNNGVYYDLSGRRVQNPQHGLYIVNGKKVVIK